MTPLHLVILLHYYTCPAPFPNQSATASEYTKELIALLLLDPSFQITPLGKAHVRQILSLPVPRSTFVGFDGKEIEL